MISMLEELKKNYQLKDRCIIWESTDGCCKQYRFGAAFLSIISTNFDVVVDRIIESPGYGKEVIDGINSCGKRYLMGEVYMIGNPEADDNEKKMNHNLMVGNTSCNLDKECKHLCEDEIRMNCVKLHDKYKKRERHTKVKEIIYHLQDKDNVEMEGIKTFIGFKKGNQMIFHPCIILYVTQILELVRMLSEGLHVPVILVSNS